MKISKQKFVEILLLTLVTELVLCGSGQVLHLYGGLSARMLLFIIALFSYIYIFNKCRIYISRTDINIFCFYFFIFSISIGVGLISNAKIEYIIKDIKPLSYFLMFPFFLCTITDEKIIKKIVKIIKYSTLSMAIIYLFYLTIIKLLGIINFDSFYVSMSTESDFMFRGETGELFYKGFVFLPIGAIFWINEKKWIPFTIMLIAIYYTLTRGFYIMTFIGIIAYIFLKLKDARITLLWVSILIIAGLYAISLGLFDMGEARTEGDYGRILTLNQVIDKINAYSLFIGNGIGIGVEFRPVHMENSFLEIFNKQGFIGLIFWIYFLSIIIFYSAKSSNNTSLIFCIGTIMIYIQSFFNPYISNPIGMGYTLIAYSVCKYNYIHYKLPNYEES